MDEKLFSIEIIDRNTIVFEGATLDRMIVAQSNRSIYMTGEYVIKVDTNYGGWNVGVQGATEVKVWEHFKGSRWEKHFAPILQAGYANGVFYVVQERITEDWDKKLFTEGDVTEFVYRVLKHDLGLKDMHEQNYIVRNNLVVVVDMGFGTEGIRRMRESNSSSSSSSSSSSERFNGCHNIDCSVCYPGS